MPLKKSEVVIGRYLYALYIVVVNGIIAAIFPLYFKFSFIGHSSWRSTVFALWDSIFAVGMSLALITFFRRFFDTWRR